MLDSLPVRRPDPHSTASTTRSSVWTGLTFSQPAPRRPASYGAVSDFAITPSWPAASVTSRNRWAAPASEVVSRSTRWVAGTIASKAAKRSLAGRSSRSTPSRCSRSKKKADNGCAARAAAMSTLRFFPPRPAPRPNRDAVAWAPATTTSSTTGCGCEVPTAGFQGNFL
jgi:hypothetical protein